jgi:hypothetical protein
LVPGNLAATALLAGSLLLARPAAAADPPGATAPLQTGPAPVSLQLHLVADDPRVRLRRVSPNAVELCGPPCDLALQVRAGEEYRFEGEGIAPSEDFFFQPLPGPVELRVHAGDAVRYQRGRWTFIGGGILAAAGVGIGLGGAVANFCLDLFASGQCSEKNARAQTFLIGGAVAAAAGLLMLLSGASDASSSMTTWQSDRRPRGAGG